MKKGIVLTVIIIPLCISIVSCSNLSGPTEIKKFTLPAIGGYRGKPVGNCDQGNANEECQLLGWNKATDWTCGTVHVTGGFFGSFDQDVMYTVTCTR